MAQAEKVIQTMAQRIAQLEMERAILAADLAEMQDKLAQMQQAATCAAPHAHPPDLPIKPVKEVE